MTAFAIRLEKPKWGIDSGRLQSFKLRGISSGAAFVTNPQDGAWEKRLYVAGAKVVKIDGSPDGNNAKPSS
ncbi:unnamed protein product [marine sediment metagenome]|uniref:Uncharacterized protein n=1 Tax=marine sediment metagenome TaxID=412755 RepID=X0WUW7_9ZZZZ